MGNQSIGHNPNTFHVLHSIPLSLYVHRREETNPYPLESQFSLENKLDFQCAYSFTYIHLKLSLLSFYVIYSVLNAFALNTLLLGYHSIFCVFNYIENKKLFVGKREKNKEKILYRILENINICCSVPKSCLTLCNTIYCNMSGFPVLHYLPEFPQSHVHGVTDAT